MKLIVGLGNPGEKYASTRHNLGFAVVDHFLKEISSVEKATWSANSKLKSDVVTIDWKGKDGNEEKLILAKPQTYMNNSGMAVQLLTSYYKIATEDVWVVYDELDLPVGFMKIRFGGAAAGHHGVESIMAQLATDQFWRFRMGIGVARRGRSALEDGKSHSLGREHIRDAEDLVLAPFTQNEQGKVREMINHGADALSLALEKGLETAMNRYNTK
ncbi:MAG: aminoacyl-tRNA hydrolase [Patescibacteria group bacterium]